MFSEELARYDWEETTQRILSKTAADVERALGKPRLALDDFMALVSPAAAPLSGADGAVEPPLHAGAVRQDHLDVHSDVHHQLVHEFVRLLRFQPPQRHPARDPHARADRSGVPRDPRTGSLREPAAGDGRKPAHRRRRLHRTRAADLPPLLQQPHHRGDAPRRRGSTAASRSRASTAWSAFRRPTTGRGTTSTTRPA